MSQPNAESAQRATPLPAQTVRRIQFVRGGPAGAPVLRMFEQPHVTVAINASGDVSSLDTPAIWPEPLDRLDLLILPENKSRQSQEQIERWLAAPNHPDAPQPTVVRLKAGVIHWRPGRAAIQASTKSADEILPGLIDFAYYEAELRRMETELEPIEAASRADVTLAYDVRHADRTQWPRLKSTMELLYTMRLSFAQLEPRLNIPPQSLENVARKVFSRLAVRSGAEDRLTAFSDRLETCQDLYEGAIDRATDSRWYRKGNRLEIAIVVLLAGETILLLLDLVLRFME
jgi:hypothetical protein